MAAAVSKQQSPEVVVVHRRARQHIVDFVRRVRETVWDAMELRVLAQVNEDGLDVTASISLILLAKMSVNPFSTQMLYGGALPIKKLRRSKCDK